MKPSVETLLLVAEHQVQRVPSDAPEVAARLIAAVRDALAISPFDNRYGDSWCNGYDAALDDVRAALAVKLRELER